MLIEARPRSHAQLAFYWVVVVPAFADYWHVPPDVAHTRMKDLANWGRTTSQLTTTGWMDYIARLTRVAKRYGITWPSPDEGRDDESNTT